MPVKWTDDLNTGIPEVDAQNRRLVDFINTLDSVRQYDDRQQLGQVLDELLDFAVNQFLFEEQLMEKAGYQYRSAHERVHEIFAKKLADFRGRFASGENVCDELSLMLNNWVQNHIKQEDKMYAASVEQVIADEGGKTWMSGLMKRFFG